MRVGIVGGSLSGIMAGVEMKTIDPRAEVVIFEQNDKVAKKYTRRAMATAIFYIATLYPPFTIILISSVGFLRGFLLKIWRRNGKS